MPAGASQYHTETPSGIGVRYQSAPRRAYWVRPPVPRPADWPEEGDGWVEVPSVTTVLNCLDKPALPWWGMRMGVSGVIELVTSENDDLRHRAQELVMTQDVDGFVRLLTEAKLTVNHVRDKAGTRGLSTHDALEVMAETGIRPAPEFYPADQRGYIQGLLHFFADLDEFESLGSEIGVGSCEHLFAGRYDWRVRLRGSLVTNVKTALMESFDGKFILDLKTSKGVYASHFLQLEAYEGASIEGGYDATDDRLVLHVTDDGGYEVVRSRAAFDDFLTVRQVYEALNRKGTR